MIHQNKINFISGETYTIGELFSDNRKIVIPDLQRDYCWGDSGMEKSIGEGRGLVDDFIRGLIKQYDSKSYTSLNLGLFYGYEIPKNHIQLCDGQQRLTTLFLLLGMLNKYTGKFRQHLISDYEFKEDDKEPYLRYAIRESSLYFLRDLVCNFFIQEKVTAPCETITVDEISSSDWYFGDYDLDPSISSMIGALRSIEELLSPKREDEEWMYEFGGWVLNYLTFIYYDMGSRENGEETFVVINTTGEPLTATQNLKPLIITANINKEDFKNGDAGKRWEEIETWFWQHRSNGNDTAEAGFREFLRWVQIICTFKESYKLEEKADEGVEEIKIQKGEIEELLQGRGERFPYDTICLKHIFRYWEAFSWIIERCHLFKQEERVNLMSPKLSDGGRISQRSCFILLPLIVFVENRLDCIEQDKSINRNTRRLYYFLENIIRIDQVSKSVNTLVYEALKIAELLKDTNGDIVNLLRKQSAVSKSLLTDEEKQKLEILKNDPEQRTKIEYAFWKLQSHSIWKTCGEIKPVIDWSCSNSVFSLVLFKKHTKTLGRLFKDWDKVGYTEKGSILRRCFIASQTNYEPLKAEGSGYFGFKSFGTSWVHCHELLTRDKESTLKMLTYIEDKGEDNTSDTGTTIENICKEYLKDVLAQSDSSPSKRTTSVRDLAENDYLMNYMRFSTAYDLVYLNYDWQVCTDGSSRKHKTIFPRRNALILREFGATYLNNYEKDATNRDGWALWYEAKKPSERSNIVFKKGDVRLSISYISKDDNSKGVLSVLMRDNQWRTQIEEKGFSLSTSVDHTPPTFDKPFAEFNATEIYDTILEILSIFDS